jgi:thioredoxin 1
MSTIEITHHNFSDHLEKEGIVFLDFWASWCGPCKAFGPIFEAAAAKNVDIVWGKVNTDQETEIANGFGIRSIPTLMVFRDGLLIYAQPGVMSAPQLDELVSRVRALDMDAVREELGESSCSQGPNCGGGCCS